MDVVYWTCSRCCHPHTSPRNPRTLTRCYACGAYSDKAGSPAWPLLAWPLPIYHHIRRYHDLWHGERDVRDLMDMHRHLNPDHAAVVPGAHPHVRWPGGYLYMAQKARVVRIHASPHIGAVRMFATVADAYGLFCDLIELAPFNMLEVADAWQFAGGVWV